MCSIALVSALLQQVSGQTPEKTAPPVVKTEKKEKLTGRLPPYFADVVSKDQRTKIYEIQTKYGEQLKSLREQIDGLEQKQQDEVMAVLSAEQRDHVAKRTADAKAKRSKKEAPVPTEQSGN
jgi:hypothetical protein